MVSEVISYRGKSALREVGKVFGLSLEQVDRLSALVSWWDKLDETPAERVRACGFDPGDTRVRQVLAMALAIQGFPRHLSIHVGGFVLSAEPLVNVAPVEPATMPNRTVIPWDKDDLDTLGFFKVDVLGLGMLTAIRKALAIVGDRPRARADGNRPAGAHPCRGHARVRGALRGRHGGRFPDREPGADGHAAAAAAARSSTTRSSKWPSCVPGPSRGAWCTRTCAAGTARSPSRCRTRLSRPSSSERSGVPLFQEQVMQLAIVGAGYSGGEADQLRRDMAAWQRNGKLARHREKLLAGFEKAGISREFAERLYQSIQGFGEYGFPESHAASFALLVYASSWLKVHHPAAFAAALINSQPMGFYSPGTIVKDAERHGVEVLPARVDASDWDCTLEGEDRALRLGLRLVRGLGEKAGERIEVARQRQPFASVEDLVSRARLDKRELEALAQAGALVAFGFERREAMWKVRAPREHALFAGLPFGDEAPELPPMSRSEQLVLDYESTGVAVGDHAMAVARPHLPRHTKSSRDLDSVPHGTSVTTAGMIVCRQRPGTASGVVFVTMEDEWGFINLILWPRTFEAFRHVATTAAMLLARGKVERQGDVIYVVPDHLEPLSLVDVPGMSRDFH